MVDSIITARKRSFGQGNIYRPQRSCGKVMFLQLSVILFTGGDSVHRGGVWQTPPREDTPAQQTPTAADGTHTTGMHSCFTGVCLSRGGVPDRDPPPPPDRDHPCMVKSGRYAYCLNAFLIFVCLHMLIFARPLPTCWRWFTRRPLLTLMVVIRNSNSN